MLRMMPSGIFPISRCDATRHARKRTTRAPSQCGPRHKKACAASLISGIKPSLRGEPPKTQKTEIKQTNKQYPGLHCQAAYTHKNKHTILQEPLRKTQFCCRYMVVVAQRKNIAIISSTRNYRPFTDKSHKIPKTVHYAMTPLAPLLQARISQGWQRSRSVRRLVPRVSGDTGADEIHGSGAEQGMRKR